MRNLGFSEKDWKLFRSKIADWQEGYMEKLERGYVELLTGAIKMEDLDDFSDEFKDTIRAYTDRNFLNG